MARDVAKIVLTAVYFKDSTWLYTELHFYLLTVKLSERSSLTEAELNSTKEQIIILIMHTNQTKLYLDVSLSPISFGLKQ